MKKWLDELLKLGSEVEAEIETGKSSEDITVKNTDDDKKGVKEFLPFENSKKRKLIVGKSKKLSISDHPEKSHLHDGHRERMREKIFKHGIDGYQQHEILEILLYYCIPRKNTNNIAHRLLDEYGNLTDIFNTDYNELKKCKFISANTAFFLYYIGQVIKYNNTNFDTQKITFKNTNEYVEYLWNIFKYLDKELVIVLYLDSSFKFITYNKIEGSRNNVEITPKMIVESAIHSDCNNVIIAHNHPHGDPKPSYQDMSMTFAIFTALKAINVNLIDHIIYTEKEYYSFKLNKDIDYMKNC